MSDLVILNFGSHVLRGVFTSSRPNLCCLMNYSDSKWNRIFASRKSGQVPGSRKYCQLCECRHVTYFEDQTYKIGIPSLFCLSHILLHLVHCPEDLSVELQVSYCTGFLPEITWPVRRVLGCSQKLLWPFGLPTTRLPTTTATYRST